MSLFPSSVIQAGLARYPDLARFLSQPFRAVA
jgi:hypothetical protein